MRPLSLHSHRCFLIAGGLVAAVFLTFLCRAAGAGEERAPASVVSLLEKASAHLARDEYRAAVDSAEKGLALAPLYLPLWRVKAEACVRAGDVVEALDAIRTLVVGEPGNPEPVDMGVDAILYRTRRDEDKIRKQLAEFITLIGQDDFSAAFARLTARRADAVTRLKLVAEAWRDSGLADEAVVRVLDQCAAGAYADAGELLASSAAADNRARGVPGFLVGRAMVLEGRGEEGARLLSQALKNGFPRGEPEWWLGVVHAENGDFAKAADSWLQVWRILNNPAGAAVDIADALLAAGDEERTIEFLDLALRAFPDHPGLQARRAAALEMAGRMWDLSRYTAELASRGCTPGLAYGKAVLARLEGDYDGLGSALEEARAELANRFGRDLPLNAVESRLDHGGEVLSPVEERELLGLAAEGRALWNAGRPVDALILWEEAMRHGVIAGPRRFAMRTADDLYAEGKPEAARALLRRHVPQIGPFDLMAGMGLANRWDRALEMAEQLAEGESRGNAWVLLFKATAALRNGSPEEVAEAMRMLADAPRDNRPLAFIRVDENDLLVSDSVSQDVRDGMANDLGERVIEDGYSDSYSFMLRSPYWNRGSGLIASVRALIRTGQSEAAKAFLEAALVEFPEEPTINFHLAYIYYREQDAKGAGERVDAGMRRAQGAVREGLLSLRARLARRNELALEHLLKYVELEPSDNDLRLMAIRDLVRNRRYAEARKLRDYFLRLQGRRAGDAQSHLALANYELGDFDKSEAVWRQLLERDPTSPRRLAGLGAALNHAENPAGTVEALTAVAEETRDPELAALIAEAQMALNEYDEVLKWTAIGLEADPEDTRLLSLGVNAAEALGDHARAEKLAKRYLAVNPDSVSMNGLYGQMLTLQQKWVELRQHNRTLLAKNPRNMGAMEREYERLAACGDPYSIWNASRALAETYGNEPAFILRNAVDAAGAGQFDYAYNTIEKIRCMGPNSAMLSLYAPRVGKGEIAGAVPLPELISHLENLAHEIRLVGVEELACGPNPEKRLPEPIPVLLLVGRSSPEALLELDAYLESVCGRAVLVLGEESLQKDTPIWPNLDFVKSLAKTERWQFILTDYEPRRFPGRGQGRETTFWTQAMWLGNRFETRGEMHRRLLGELERMTDAAREAGIELCGWLHPEWGDYGQRGIEARLDEVMAYRNAVKERFTVAFTQTATGYRIPGGDCLRVPVRALAANTEECDLLAAIQHQHPTRRAVLDLGKVKSWHSQYPAADELFKLARVFGLDPKEISYFQGRNSYYEGDVPTALALAYEAESHDPGSERTRLLKRDAHRLLRPHLSIDPRFWHDSDDQSYQEIVANGSYHILPSLQLRASAGAHRWKDDDGSLLGASLGLGLRYYFRPGNYLQGDVKAVAVNKGVGTHLEGGLLWHGVYNLDGQNFRFNGTFDLEFRHEGIETRRAQLAGIRANRFSASTSARIHDFWDLDASASFTTRTDDNDTWQVMFRPMRRLREIPQLRFGYWFAAADSDRNPDEYYAPVNYQAHQLVATYRQNINDCLSASALASFGVAKSEGTGWRGVFRFNAGLRYKLNECTDFSANYQYLKLPDYSLHNYMLSFGYRF